MLAFLAPGTTGYNSSSPMVHTPVSMALAYNTSAEDTVEMQLIFRVVYKLVIMYSVCVYVYRVVILSSSMKIISSNPSTHLKQALR
jgi:hypothetical protein